MTVDSDHSSTTSLQISCDGQDELTLTLSTDQSKVIPRDQLTNDITLCTVAAQASNDVGKGKKAQSTLWYIEIIMMSNPQNIGRPCIRSICSSTGMKVVLLRAFSYFSYYYY